MQTSSVGDQRGWAATQRAKETPRTRDPLQCFLDGEQKKYQSSSEWLSWWPIGVNRLSGGGEERVTYTHHCKLCSVNWSCFRYMSLKCNMREGDMVTVMSPVGLLTTEFAIADVTILVFCNQTVGVKYNRIHFRELKTHCETVLIWKQNEK